jgi:hypothetical protein
MLVRKAYMYLSSDESLALGAMKDASYMYRGA